MEDNELFEPPKPLPIWFFALVYVAINVVIFWCEYQKGYNMYAVLDGFMYGLVDSFLIASLIYMKMKA